MPADLDSAADELYGLGPDELDAFNQRRTELVAAARSAGDRDLARQIGKLRKPVQAAALVNHLVQHEPTALDELTSLGQALRDAHRHLRGPELRKLSEQRQRVLTKLTELARTGGSKPGGSKPGGARPVTDAVLGQVRATFEAAIADEDAEQAVLSGRLTAALSYSGFGAVDIGDAVAVPRRLRAVPTPEGTKASAPEPAPADRGLAERGLAERAVERAELAHETALDALDRAVEQLDSARNRHTELSRRVEQLRAELSTSERDAARAADSAAAAEKAHRKAARAVERAGQALAEARAALD